jgi:uncharacterized membrane protein
MRHEATPRSAQDNIDMVVRLEQQALAHRHLKDRIGDAIAGAVGTMKFATGQFAIMLAWFILNSGLIFGIQPWDPYPYVLLTLIVSAEGVLVTVFVLMKQNRMSRRADQRDHLHLQIDLLAEKEITKILQLQKLMCLQMGIREADKDQEVDELSRHTAVEDLAHALDKRLPEE